MTPQTLSAHLKSLGLSAGGFARLIDVSKRTVERYLSGAVAIPGPVARLSDLMMFQTMQRDVGIRATLELWAQKNIHASDKMS